MTTTLGRTGHCSSWPGPRRAASTIPSGSRPSAVGLRGRPRRRCRRRLEHDLPCSRRMTPRACGARRATAMSVPLTSTGCREPTFPPCSATSSAWSHRGRRTSVDVVSRVLARVTLPADLPLSPRRSTTRSRSGGQTRPCSSRSRCGWGSATPSVPSCTSTRTARQVAARAHRQRRRSRWSARRLAVGLGLRRRLRVAAGLPPNSAVLAFRPLGLWPFQPRVAKSPPARAMSAGVAFLWRRWTTSFCRWRWTVVLVVVRTTARPVVPDFVGSAVTRARPLVLPRALLPPCGRPWAAGAC